MPRHKEQGISRFNVNAHLVESEKFQKFRLFLGISESQAYAILIRFWNCVATNRAMNGNIQDIEQKYLGHYCWLSELQIDTELFIKALTKSGFLDEDLNIHDWFDHQPLAKEVLRNRNRRIETAESNEDSEIRPGYNQDITGLKPGYDRNKTALSKVKESKGKRSKGKERKSSLSSTPQKLNSMTSESFVEKYNKLSEELRLIPSCRTPLAEHRKKKYTVLIKKGYNPEEILQDLHDSTVGNGTKTGRAIPSIDWLFNSTNAEKLHDWATKDRKNPKASGSQRGESDMEKWAKEHGI